MRPVNVLAAASILLPTTSAFSFTPKARHYHANPSTSRSRSSLTFLRMMGGYGDGSDQNYYYNSDDGYYYYESYDEGSGDESYSYYHGEDGYYYYYPEEQSQQQSQQQQWNGNYEGNSASEPPLPTSNQRRSLLSNLAAGSVVLASSGAANAFDVQPTKIELDVDTEYLVRVLDYFHGDMRQVLGVLIKSPLTKVKIDTPNDGKKVVNGLTAKDAILRSLYSYDNPDDYVDQASWLNVESNNKGLMDFLTSKRYNFSLDTKQIADKYAYLRWDTKKPVSTSNQGDSDSYAPKTTTISLSNLEAAIGIAAASYPLAYGYYNYESFLEEQEKKAKKEAAEAKKKAAAAKAKAASKKEGAATAPTAKKEKPVKAETTPKKEADGTWSETELAAILEKKPKAAAATLTAPEPVKEVAEASSPAADFIQTVEAAAENALMDQQLQQQKKKKTSSGGMDAYAAQMAAAAAAAAAPKVVEVQEDPVVEEIAAATFPSAAPKKKKSSGGMDAYEAQMRAMMQNRQ